MLDHLQRHGRVALSLSPPLTLSHSLSLSLSLSHRDISISFLSFRKLVRILYLYASLLSDQTQIQRVIEANFIPLLVTLIRRDEFEIRKEACFAICNATIQGNSAQLWCV